MAYEVDWLKKNLKKSIGASYRKAFIEFGNEYITVKRQAELLGINRSSVYRGNLLSGLSNEFETPRELRIMLIEYMKTYNTYRPHSSLGGACPVVYYLKSMLNKAA